MSGQMITHKLFLMAKAVAMVLRHFWHLLAFDPRPDNASINIYDMLRHLFHILLKPPHLAAPNVVHSPFDHSLPDLRMHFKLTL